VGRETLCFTSLLDSFYRNLIKTWRFRSFQLFSSSFILVRTKLKYQWLSCVYFRLPDIDNPMYIQWLTKLILPFFQNTAGICKKVTTLIFYQLSSRLVAVLKFLCNYIVVPHAFLVLFFQAH